MKLFSTSLSVLLFFLSTQARVFLNRQHAPAHQTRLFTNYPRYLVPDKTSTQTALPAEDSPKDRILLDNSSPEERKLFMMTDYEAQKKRFGQRMQCKFA